MRAIPEASPSSPSMRLNAFTAPTIQNTVRTQSTAAGSAGHRVLKPRPPQNHVANATTICPSSLSFGGRLHLSSASPSRKITPASAVTRTGCVPTPEPTQRLPVANTYTRNDPNSPRKSATPPPRGIGTLFILRGSGLSTIPSLRLTSRTIGVRTSVSASAAEKTIRKGSIRMKRFIISHLLRHRILSAKAATRGRGRRRATHAR